MPPPRRLRAGKTPVGDGLMTQAAAGPAIDPVVTAVIANRIDGIVREMTNTPARAARSAVISSARDFSCGICTADNQLLACVEGLPIHIFGVHEQARAMTTAHPVLAEAMHSCTTTPIPATRTRPTMFLVPVFIDGEHSSPPSPRRNQADIGNSIPVPITPAPGTCTRKAR